MLIPTLQELNHKSEESFKKELYLCCSSSKWVDHMLVCRPFLSEAALFQVADEAWFSLEKQDWLEAFSHHPRIGASLDALREKYASTQKWASQEQSSVAQASDEVLKKLQAANIEYEKKFGHVFLICATGKTADEMLSALELRIQNLPEVELKNAAIEQSKITRIRLEKLLKAL